MLSVIIFSFSACTNYNVDVSYLPKEKIEKFQKLLDESLSNYNKATKDEDKAIYAEQIGSNYMTLGKFKEAMDYYNKELAISPKAFIPLNNIASMYEQLGLHHDAVIYEQRLYESGYGDNQEVISDLIRMLIADGRASTAQGVIETYAGSVSGKDPKNSAFISSEMSDIQKALNKK